MSLDDNPPRYRPDRFDVSTPTPQARAPINLDTHHRELAVAVEQWASQWHALPGNKAAAAAIRAWLRAENYTS